MDISIFEVGSDKTDVQTGSIKGYKGNINDYVNDAIKDIKDNPDLKFLSYSDTGNGGVLIEYENIKMNNKYVRHYASELKA